MTLECAALEVARLDARGCVNVKYGQVHRSLLPCAKDVLMAS